MEEKMKLRAIVTAPAMSVALGWIGLAGFASVASAGEAHAIIAPDGVKWGPGPKVLPPGAEAAVLFGDPSKEGLFGLRVKFPAGYAIPPHTHPVIEAVTVISDFQARNGRSGRSEATKALPAGSFFALPIGMAHFVYIDEPTVIQIAPMARGASPMSIRRTILGRRNSRGPSQKEQPRRVSAGPSFPGSQKVSTGGLEESFLISGAGSGKTSSMRAAPVTDLGPELPALRVGRQEFSGRLAVVAAVALEHDPEVGTGFRKKIMLQQ